MDVYGILKTGGTLIVDEIEKNIHMDLVNRIINKFMNKEDNPKNAKLIFSTHNPEFLDRFHKSQIYIVEKDNKLETQVYRLSDYKGIRSDENHVQKYLNGAYGGKPRIEDF